jgi:hypothetical protein
VGRVVTAPDSWQRKVALDHAQQGWPLELLAERDEIHAELERRQAEIADRRARCPAGQSGIN